MHIAYLSPSWPPVGAANGIVTYVSAIRTYLLEQGHEVSVLSQGRLFTGDGGEHDFDAHMSVRKAIWARIGARIDGHLGHRPCSARAIAARFKEACGIAPIDLVEMEESFGWVCSAQRRLSVPVVTRLHGPIALKPKLPQPAREARWARHRMSAEGRAIRTASALTAPSRAVLDAACSLYGRSGAPGKVIPNPVPVAPEGERWRPDACERDLILNVGRFDQIKGADTMLAAFEQVLAQRPAARLIMVGPDTGLTVEDGRTLGWEAYAAEFVSPEARKRIRFLGTQTPDEIAVLRRRASLTVVASRWESFCYAAVEAMAVGSPLISTSWAGSADIVSHGRSGWLTPIARPQPMAERICSLLSNPDVAQRTGAAAWSQCRGSYSLGVVGARTVRFYEEILSGAGRT
jgi:glycosyltransferase involved in cell wall biosynthesis